jgi:molecular chaperone GrpE
MDEETKIEAPAGKTPEERCAALEADWKRALADYQNLQREVAKERVEMGQYAVLRVVERFLTLLDYLKQAQATKPPSDDKAVANWMTGVDHVARLFEEALRDLGLMPIRTVGEKFDAARHEAVGEEEKEGAAHGSVLREVQAGYEMGGKAVRPAKVIIAK